MNSNQQNDEDGNKQNVLVMNFDILGSMKVTTWNSVMYPPYVGVVPVQFNCYISHLTSAVYDYVVHKSVSADVLQVCASCLHT